MKVQFKKMALAMGTLAVTSLPAHAIIEAVPGEANLLPLMVHSETGGIQDVDTLIRITVPKAVGNDVILNDYTAPNSSPTNGDKAKPGSEDPGAAALSYWTPSGINRVTGSNLHWYFFNHRSEKVANGTIPVTQDDVVIRRWPSLGGPAWNNQPGYMIIVTDAGNKGDAANFSFTVDTWLRVQNKVLSLPTIPMSDGADNKPSASSLPTITNNVVEIRGNQLDPIASPLITGQPTVWSDGQPNSTVIDLAIGSTRNTLAVVWNDVNGNNLWTGISAYRFNNHEEKCSGSISLPDELNIIAVGKEAIGPSSEPGNGDTNPEAPYWWQRLVKPDGKKFVQYNYICDVDTGSGSEDEYSAPSGLSGGYGYDDAVTEAWLGIGGECGPFNGDEEPNCVVANSSPGGFVKLVLPEPFDNAKFAPEAAAVTFTIPLIGNDQRVAGAAILGHYRGAFTDAPN
jgi:hypothetical protein